MTEQNNNIIGLSHSRVWHRRQSWGLGVATSRF